MAGNRAVTMAFVLGLSCLLAGVSAGNSFPYCNCVRPKGYKYSPYTLAPPNSYTNPDGSTKVCWALDTNAYATGPCAEFDLRKIELNINTQCRGAVSSMTFADETFSPSYTVYTEQDAVVFKITRGVRDLASFNSLLGKTTPVCITFTPDHICNSVSDFCYGGKCDFAFFSSDLKCCPGNYFAPSPPPPSPRPPSPRPPSPSPPPPPSPSPPPPPSPSPPPPPVGVSPFPYCACNTNPAYNSFNLESYGTPTTAGGRTTYCWDLSAQRYSGEATKCVNFDLRKIEWDIKAGCQGAVTAITLDGQPIAPSYARYPRGGLALKVTHGTSNLATLDSLVYAPQRLCMTLGGACPTLDSLCTTPYCKVAFFSPSKKCCPLQDVIY